MTSKKKTFPVANSHETKRKVRKMLTVNGMYGRTTCKLNSNDTLQRYQLKLSEDKKSIVFIKKLGGSKA